MGINESMCKGNCNCKNNQSEFRLENEENNENKIEENFKENINSLENKNLFKIKKSAIKNNNNIINKDNQNDYSISNIIYLQKIIKGFIYRKKKFPLIKEELKQNTLMKIEYCKNKLEPKTYLNSINKIIYKKYFKPFDYDSWKLYYDKSESYLFKYNSKKYGKIFYCPIFIYQNFNSSEIISYYIGNLNYLNLRCGYGKLITINGIISEGNWICNKLNGWCRVIDSNNFTVSEGLYIDNILEGYGKYLFNNGDYYEGYFKNGKMDGKGKYIWKEGEIYEGEYRNGIKEGYGIFKWNNGKFYKGTFINGKPDKNGQYKNINEIN